MLLRKHILFSLLIVLSVAASAQQDTTPPTALDSFLLKQKGIIGDLARGLLADSLIDDIAQPLQRNDQAFERYRGLIIRQIVIRPLDFGMSIGDTSKRINNKLTSIANKLHRNTEINVIRRNLFFHENERISPYLLGINERHLRDVNYLQDARIRVLRLKDTDSADVYVITKDAFSLGTSGRIDRLDKFEGTIGEDNIYGKGDGIQLMALYDGKRNERFGTGAEFVKRNIGGSFTDFFTGYRTYNRSFSSGRQEELTAYAGFIKPLVHPLMRLTYAAEASLNTTDNQYNSDSLYKADYKYRFVVLDGWAGWNFSAGRKAANSGSYRNWLISARSFRKLFVDRPDEFMSKYFYRYINFRALLGAISFFNQDFYRTQYVYGFGRYEDVPEGEDASLTAGWTKTNDRVRAYAGLDYKRNFFTRHEAYFNFSVGVGGYFYKRGVEDVGLVSKVDYFSRLHRLSPKWKQRSFITLTYSRIINYVMSEPLLINNEYGITGYNNNNTGGDRRTTVKAESVFFSPWSVLYFKLAPFAFGQMSLFHINELGYKKRQWYSAVGAGLRMQNESLIFGTIEVRAQYYPRPDFLNEQWKIGFATNVRFRYNRQFVKRPEIVSVNNSRTAAVRAR
jgi:hypothetical protein